jgi:hypothetical protein
MDTDNLSTILAFMLADLPGVRIGKHIHNINFLVGEKVFAFIKGDEGVAMKLPRAKCQELIAQQQAIPLVMGKRVMKEWIVLQHESAEDYKADLALFQESIAFVSAKA